MSTRPWYLADGGKRLGPYEPAEISALVQSGAIRHATLVWNEDLEGWMAARDVPEMKLYLRGIPEQAASPAAVSTEVLSKLVDQVTAEVTAEVMGNFDSFAKEAAVTKSGRHVAVGGEPAAAPARAPAPAAPAAAARPAARASEPVARPAAVPAAASTARVPSTPSIPAVSPAPAPVPAAASAVPVSRPAEPTRTAIPVSPYGTMPDPFASRSHAVPGRLTGPVEIPTQFLHMLGMLVKGAGGLAILVGVICVLFAIDKSGGGLMQRIAWFGVFSMPLVVGLGLFGFGLFLDLWLVLADRLRPVLEAARKDEGPVHDAGEPRRGVLPYSG